MHRFYCFLQSVVTVSRPYCTQKQCGNNNQQWQQLAAVTCSVILYVCLKLVIRAAFLSPFRSNHRCRQHIHIMTQGRGFRIFHLGYHHPLGSNTTDKPSIVSKCEDWWGPAVSPSGAGWDLSKQCRGQLLLYVCLSFSLLDTEARSLGQGWHYRVHVIYPTEQQHDWAALLLSVNTCVPRLGLGNPPHEPPLSHEGCCVAETIMYSVCVLPFTFGLHWFVHTSHSYVTRFFFFQST